MLSSSGFRDALGERDLRFNRESGQVHERLFLRPELAAYESALRRRVGRLASLTDPRLVAVETLEQDALTRRVAVVSRHASGLRLDGVLRTARERELVPELTVALYLTAELLLAAQSFQLLSGLPHGAITPQRVIVAPDGDVLLADFAYAEVLEAARFTPARLWREFGIASWLGAPFSFAGDVRQCALIGIALMLGRPLPPDACDRLETLLSEVEEAAMIRAGRLFADPVIAWLRRAVNAGNGDGFEAAEDAAQACVALLTERERTSARPAVVQFLEELDAPPVPDLPEEPLIAAEQQPPASEAAPLGFEEALAAYAAPGPEFLPVSEPQPLTDALPEPDADLISAFDQEPAPAPEGEEAVSAVASAEEPPARSVPDWMPAPASAPPVAPEAGPRVVSPSPFAVALAAPRLSNAPAFDRPEDAAAPTASAALPVPPFAAPLARNLEPPAPPRMIPAATGVAPVAPAPTESAIRLKSEPTIRLKHAAPSKRRGTTSLGLDLSDRADSEAEQIEDAPGGGWEIPWKYVAAAVVVVATGIAAVTVNWGSATPVEASRPKAIEAPLPPPPTTGSIEVLSNTPGSKVLVDGKLRGETPLTIDDLQPGRHVVVVRAPNGNVRRAVTVKVGEVAKIDLAVYSGWVVVSAPIELQVLENGKVIGTAGEGPIVLAAGHHVLEVANAMLEYRSSHPIDIQPGEEQRLDLNPQGLANLNAVPWAEVWLDGTKLGDTPLGNVAVPLGTREFVFKNPQFGERKVSMTITGEAAAQVSVDFTK